MASLVGNERRNLTGNDEQETADRGWSDGNSPDLNTDMEMEMEEETIVLRPTKKKRGRPAKATREIQSQSTPKPTTSSRANQIRTNDISATGDNPGPDGEHGARDTEGKTTEGSGGVRRKTKATVISDEKVEQMLQFMDEKFNQLRDRYNEVTGRCEALETMWKRRLDNIEQVLDKEVIEIHERLEDTDARFRSMRNNPRGNTTTTRKDLNDLFQRNPLGKLSKVRINGSEKNPMASFEEVERRLQDVVDEDTKLKLVGMIMEGNAKHWFEIKARAARTWTEFKKMFKETYWNPYVQEGVRDEIESGRYRKDLDMTRLNYAYDLMARAEHLEPKIPESMLVSRLVKHFGDTFYECANLRCIETVEEFVKLIQRFETKHMWERNSRDYGGLGTRQNLGYWGFKTDGRNLNGNWRDKNDEKKGLDNGKKFPNQMTWKDKIDLGKNNQRKGQIRALLIDEETDTEEEEAKSASTQTESSENSLGLED